MELAPLTILVGANNSGKTVLAQAIPLLAGGLVPMGEDISEPLPLVSGGIRHGETFEDLVAGRSAHGHLHLTATFADHGTEMSLGVTVRNVISQDRPTQRQISHWRLQSDGLDIELHRQEFDEQSRYSVFVSGTEQTSRSVRWRGLVPSEVGELADGADARMEALKAWASGIRHLQCPRALRASSLTATGSPPKTLGPKGQEAPLALAADDTLRASVRDWYRKVFGVSLDLEAQGRYFDLVTHRSGEGGSIGLAQSGRGLSHVLPVVVMAFTAGKAKPGVDIIEHPEAELHPAVHAEIAELILESLAGRRRPMIVETHSEMLILRARRWIAEKRIPPKDVLVYWIDVEGSRGSTLRKIKIDDKGDMDQWPEGVFVEDYEEIIAIRRAARQNG